MLGVYMAVDWEYYDRADAKGIKYFIDMVSRRGDHRPGIDEIIMGFIESFPLNFLGKATGSDFDIRANWTEFPDVYCCEF